MRSKNGQYAPPPSADLKGGEDTAAQAPGLRRGGMLGLAGGLAGPLAMPGLGFTAANGGFGWDNPCGFPGYDGLYTGNYITYRWMLSHPTLRLVRGVAVSDILASYWEYDGPAASVAAVSENFDRLRSSLMTDFFIRGRDYGWAPGEVVWKPDGRYRTNIDRIKPLLQDYTWALRDVYGNFTGVRNYAPQFASDTDLIEPAGADIQGPSGYVDLAAPYKAWLYIYDSEAGYLYGRSWLENVRMTAWRDWLDCAQQLQRLGAKITGIISIICSPAGEFPGPGGTTVSYQKTATDAIKALSTGAPGIWIPGISFPNFAGSTKLDTAKIIRELVGVSQTTVQPLDFGSTTPAIIGLLERMKHNEELMFEGGLRPARSGKQGEHGTQADAEQHTDTGTKNAELDDHDFARQCQPLLDAFLRVNVGVNAVGTVRICPPSLVDRVTPLFKAILLSIMNEPQVAVEMAATLDMDHHLDKIGMKRVKDFDPAAVKKMIADSQKPKATPEPQGGRPTSQ